MQNTSEGEKIKVVRRELGGPRMNFTVFRKRKEQKAGKKSLN